MVCCGIICQDFIKTAIHVYACKFLVMDHIEFLPHQAGGKAASRVGPKIVLDHMRMYIFIYVCALWVSSPLVIYDAIDNVSSSRAMRTEK